VWPKRRFKLEGDCVIPINLDYKAWYGHNLINFQLWCIKFMANPIIFTDSAASKVSELISEEGNDNLKLRVYVSGGGCSGFQYGFTFDEEVNEDDTSVVNGGVTVLIDSMSIQYLAGAEVDYKEDISGAQFVIRNPNATTTCGCGSSFSA
jgi:iron-sulfur cluster insertion protein